MRRALILFVFGALALIPSPGWGQGDPAGAEFRVNTYTTGVQGKPSVASDPAGNFVVVWSSQQDPVYGVFAQRFSGTGAPLGAEFRVNTFTTGAQDSPAIAADPSGNFVVVWESSQDGSGKGIFGQRYDAGGVPLGAEFRVNTFFTLEQLDPSVASDNVGNFVVVWVSDSQDGSSYGVFGQRYFASGTPLGTEFRVNTHTTNDQIEASVASDAGGNFVVIWSSYGQDTGLSLGVYGQRFASSGEPQGPEFRVNTYITGSQGHPAIASDPVGNFIVVWEGPNQDGGAFGVFGQRFASTGSPVGAEFRVNTFTTLSQQRPAIVTDPAGNFVVVWESALQDGSSYGVFGQRYASSGDPSGPEFRVNTYTISSQYRPVVSSDTSGNFVIGWQSNTQDGSSFGVFGQRYSQMVPVGLMHFGIE